MVSTTPISETPNINRFIFPHISNNHWHDKHGFNNYFIRAAYPSISIECDSDWTDRIAATVPNTTFTASKSEAKAWHFPTLLLHDRSAAWRGKECNENTHRTASEAVAHMTSTGRITSSWWDPIRTRLLTFAGTDDNVEKITITYISRQRSRRHLLDSVRLTIIPLICIPLLMTFERLTMNSLRH